MRTLIENIKAIHGIHDPGTRILKGKDLESGQVIENGYVLIEDGKILKLGKMADWSGHADNIFDGNGRLVIPAYADSHTHLVFAESRESEFEDRIRGLSYEEIANRGGGILNSAAKLREMSEEELYDRAEVRLNEINRQGTASVEIKSGYGLDPASEVKMLKVIRRLKENSSTNIKATFLGAHAVPPEYRGRTREYVQYMIDHVLPVVAEEELADYIDIFCEKGYFGLEETRMVMEAGALFGLPSKIHVNQFNAFGGVELAVQHNALSVDHLEVMEREDIMALSGSDTIATLLPSCSYFLSIPYAPARALLDADVAVALASDFNPGSTPSGNMNFVWSTACVKMKMTPMEGLNAASLNGAAAMGLADITGSISPGKRADLILTKPVSGLSYLPYAFGTNWIERVFIDGMTI